MTLTRHTPRPAAGHQLAAAAMRGIGQRRHHRAGTSGHFVCSPCRVAWAGAEADCWNCGSPASAEHSHRGAALQRLLAAVTARPAMMWRSRR
ncbi:hypothetical protein [Streptomyces mayteni]